MEVMEAQPRNTSSPIFVTLLGMVMEVRAEQSEKASSPMLETVAFRIVIDVSPMQWNNAPSPMLFMLLPIVKEHQSEAEFEQIVTNAGYIVAQGHRCQSDTSLEGTVADECHIGRNGNGGYARISFERIVTDAGDVVSQVNGFQTDTALERTISYTYHAVRNGYRGYARISFERIVADDGNGQTIDHAWYNDAFS